MKIKRFIYRNRWYDSVILFVFILAFAGATYNHVMDLVHEGLFPYTNMWGTPDVFNLYWTSLSILDPLAIALLIKDIRAGYVLALCIMLTDVPINLYANVNYWSLEIHKNYFLLMQIAFLVFLLSTTRRIWKLSQNSSLNLSHRRLDSLTSEAGRYHIGENQLKEGDHIKDKMRG
jgi:hypothetical protein